MKNAKYSCLKRQSIRFFYVAGIIPKMIFESQEVLTISTVNKESK